MSPVPHQIYSQELSNAFRRGHPIANPQPVDYSGDDEHSDGEEQTLRPVEIGDVGYIQHDTGLFIRLFNVHLEPGVNGQPMREGLPPDGFNFRPLRRGMISKSKDTTPVFVSQSVETVKLNAAASGPFFGGSAGFSASSNRGAILATPDPIECQNALNIPSYLTYAKAHVKEWHSFYSQTHQIELEDLILVTGVDRTTSWATAVFSDTSLNVGFGLDVQFAGAGGDLQLACQYSWRSTLGALVNAGPVPRSMPDPATGITGSTSSRIRPVPLNHGVTSPVHNATQIDRDADRRAINTVSDQTLFIRHIRAKRRPWRGMKLEARGEKDDTDDGEDGEDDSGDGMSGMEDVIVTSYPQRDKFVDCLEPALDYILEHSDSDIAVAHDQDLVLLEDPSFAHQKPLIVIEDGIGILRQPSDLSSAVNAGDESAIQNTEHGLGLRVPISGASTSVSSLGLDLGIPELGDSERSRQWNSHSDVFAHSAFPRSGAELLYGHSTGIMPVQETAESPYQPARVSLSPAYTSLHASYTSSPVSKRSTPRTSYDDMAPAMVNSGFGREPAILNTHSAMKEQSGTPSHHPLGYIRNTLSPASPASQQMLYTSSPSAIPHPFVGQATPTPYLSSLPTPSNLAVGKSRVYSPEPRTTSQSHGKPNRDGSPFPIDIPGRGRMIPQSKYRPHTAADRDRYVNKVTLDDPVLFNTTTPGVVGIALSDALAGKYQQLDGRDDRLFQQCGPSISIRVNWAGCYPAWSRQIPTRDFKNPPGPVTRSKVAKNVARSIERFIDEMNGKQLERDADPGWAVGRARNGIVLEDLALVRLEHVSKGSWQVHLCFVHDGISKGGQ